MPDILAIVSKGIFEQGARANGKLLGPGSVWPTDRYTSKNKALASLAQGGRLVLVTVRPPNEHLWLVAILEDLTQTADAWVTKAPNAAPIADITPLRKTLKFATGKGLSQEKGTLGMSLQTPRALAPEDMTDILASLGAAPGPEDVNALLPPGASPALASLLAELAKDLDDELLRERVARRLVSEGALANAKKLLAKWKHLNAHETGGLPCLCKRCIDSAPAETSASDLTFGRDFVLRLGRVLHFWVPKDIQGTADLYNSVRTSLSRRIATLARERKERARKNTIERSLARKKARAKASKKARAR